MVNYIYNITIEPILLFANPSVISEIDRSHFWIDYDETRAEFTGDTLINYGLSGDTYTLLSILQFYNSRIKSMTPFSIPDISDLNDNIQMFVYFDNDALKTDKSIFSIIRQ